MARRSTWRRGRRGRSCASPSGARRTASDPRELDAVKVPVERREPVLPAIVGRQRQREVVPEHREL
jgi:hypothetical protein